MRLNQYNGGKYNINENYFDEINTPEKARVLGYLFADGNNYIKEYKITINVKRSSRDILEQICKILETDKPIKDYIVNGKEASRLIIKNKKISLRLNELGMIPNKSLKIKYPDIPAKFDLDFIAGVWMGDGMIFVPKNLNKRNPVIGFCGNKEFILEIKNKLESVIDGKFSENFQSNILHIRSGSVHVYKKLFNILNKKGLYDPDKFAKLSIGIEKIEEKYANRQYTRKIRS